MSAGRGTAVAVSNRTSLARDQPSRRAVSSAPRPARSRRSRRRWPRRRARMVGPAPGMRTACPIGGCAAMSMITTPCVRTARLSFEQFIVSVVCVRQDDSNAPAADPRPRPSVRGRSPRPGPSRPPRTRSAPPGGSSPPWPTGSPPPRTPYCACPKWRPTRSSTATPPGPAASSPSAPPTPPGTCASKSKTTAAPGRPAHRHHDHGGRGLAILTALTRWDSTTDDRGHRTVWFEITP